MNEVQITMNSDDGQQNQVPDAMTVRAALWVGPDALDRFGRVLRHLAVGLVDQAVQLRLLSSDPRVDALTLGPVQTLVHGPIHWPVSERRIAQLAASLSPQPPTVIHALSAETYRLAGLLAAAIDADLILQVTSQADCGEIARLHRGRVGRFLAFSEPLASVLVSQVGADADRVAVLRPGLKAASNIACFADVHEPTTLLCTSSFERASGVDRLVEAAAILRQRGFDFMLFLMGRGPYESALRRLVRQRELFSSVTFARPMGDPAHAMQAADIFVRPSVDVAFVEDTLQAMAAGVATVVFGSELCDHLKHGETAVVCSSTAVEALAEGIERLMMDRAYAQRIAGGALEYVRAHHQMSQMAEAAASTYRHLALTRTTFPIR